MESRLQEVEMYEGATEVLFSKVHTSFPRSGYQCLICSSIFRTPDKIKAHVRTHTGEKPFKCAKCHHSFSQRQNYTRHCKLHLPQENRPYKCTYIECDKTYIEERHLLKHIESSHDLKTHKTPKPSVPHSCDICNVVCANKYSLKSHKQLRHELLRQHQCMQCMKMFQTTFNLKRHLLSHTNFKKFSCSRCNNKFTEKKNLLRHIKTVHFMEKYFECKICNKKVSSQASLNTHMNIHKKRYPHQCPKCDKAFKARSTLNCHYKNRHKHVKYRCNYEGCNTELKNKSSYNRHTHTHNINKPFLCDGCGISFSRLQYLHDHWHDKSSPKTPYACPNCEKAFVFREGLLRHTNGCRGELTLIQENSDYTSGLCVSKISKNMAVKKLLESKEKLDCRENVEKKDNLQLFLNDVDVLSTLEEKKSNSEIFMEESTVSASEKYAPDIKLMENNRGTHKSHLLTTIKNLAMKEENTSKDSIGIPENVIEMQSSCSSSESSTPVMKDAVLQNSKFAANKKNFVMESSVLQKKYQMFSNISSVDFKDNGKDINKLEEIIVKKNKHTPITILTRDMLRQLKSQGLKGVRTRYVLCVVPKSTLNRSDSAHSDANKAKTMLASELRLNVNLANTKSTGEESIDNDKHVALERNFVLQSVDASSSRLVNMEQYSDIDPNEIEFQLNVTASTLNSYSDQKFVLPHKSVKNASNSNTIHFSIIPSKCISLRSQGNVIRSKTELPQSLGQSLFCKSPPAKLSNSFGSDISFDVSPIENYMADLTSEALQTQSETDPYDIEQIIRDIQDEDPIQSAGAITSDNDFEFIRSMQNSPTENFIQPSFETWQVP